ARCPPGGPPAGRGGAPRGEPRPLTVDFPPFADPRGVPHYTRDQRREDMLQNIGDKLKGQGDGSGRTGRWIWYLIIGALGLVFAAWGPYTVVDLSFGQNSYAVRVNGEEVPAEEVIDLWQRQQPQLMEAYGGDLNDELRARLQQEILDVQVRELATKQHAREVGFAVSDAAARPAAAGKSPRAGARACRQAACARGRLCRVRRRGRACLPRGGGLPDRRRVQRAGGAAAAGQCRHQRAGLPERSEDAPADQQGAGRHRCLGFPHADGEPSPAGAARRGTRGALPAA